MQKRNLGKSMKVSSVGLGCMGITHASGTPLTKAEGMKVLESALEIGYNFLIQPSAILEPIRMARWLIMRRLWALF